MTRDFGSFSLRAKAIRRPGILLSSRRKSPLTPPFDDAQGMLFQRGEQEGARKSFRVMLYVRKASPFEKEGQRRICSRPLVAVITRQLVGVLSVLLACSIATVPA